MQAAIASALATSPYTFALGAAWLLLVIVVLAMPRLLRWSVAASPLPQHLGPRQLHAIDESSIRFESAWLRARSTWSNLRRWTLHDGELFLWCGGMPAVVIPEHALVEAGCLEAVLALARQSAKDPGSTPARF